MKQNNNYRIGYVIVYGISMFVWLNLPLRTTVITTIKYTAHTLRQGPPNSMGKDHCVNSFGVIGTLLSQGIKLTMESEALETA